MFLALFVVLFMARAASLDLVCGWSHNCVFERGQEAMKCWGNNDAGQLGYNDTNNRGDNATEMGANLIFVHIGTGFVVEDMKLGRDHSCAKSVDRAMKCFGRNTLAQLGFDGVTTTGDALQFLVFGADFNLSKIAAGRDHTCALSTDAALKCFGRNNYGQCGAGTSATSIRGPPSQINAVDLGTNFTTVDVHTFWDHVCVKSQQGTAKCFGFNNAGQLGYGDTTTRGATPGSMGDGLPIVYLGSDFTVAAIATGGWHSCALSTAKTVKCWGCAGFDYGQCGTPHSTETGDDLPVLDLGVDFVPMQLALGYLHTCILAESATLLCFGRNTFGQLGLGHTNNVGTPITLTGIDLGTGFVPRQVAAGQYHNCAVSTTDAIKCWGNNGDGQLGLGHANSVGDGLNEMGDNLPFVDVDLLTTGPTTTPTIAASATAAPQDPQSSLLEIEWVGIGIGAVCLLSCLCVCLLCFCVRSRSKLSDSQTSGSQQVVINNTVYTAVSQIPMAGTAVAGTQKNRKEPEKNTGADEEEKVDDVLLADADTILVKNALVLSVGVSEYNTKDNLPGVITDVENHRYLWKSVYNYRVIPDKDDFDAPRWFNKKYWTYEDIEEFIQEKREELFDRDDKLLYDALIITLNGHGSKNGILPSDYDANDKDKKFPVNYSLLQIFVDGNWKAVMSTFPRIFIVDACRGSSDDAAIRPDEAPQERGNPGTVHKDALTCMLYGNSPGFKVREHAARGGNFSQCLFAELKETNDASTSPPLSIITSRTSKALKRKSDKEQTCWLEGDPQCNNVVFVRKK